MTENLLETAIANWGPRFTANGVDASDFATITSALSHWDEWCAAWSSSAASYQSLAETAAAAGHHRTAGELFSRSATYFHFGKFLFVHERQQAREASDRAVAALQAALPYLDPSGTRIEIPYRDHHLAGILRCPPGDGPWPTVWLIPGLDSTKEELREVERSFLGRGMATFACDGPGQGEVEWFLPIEADWAPVGEAVVQALFLRPEVDQDRLGVWGVSLGGYYASRVAAAQLPIRATIALSGPYDFGAAFAGLNPLTRRAFEVRSFATSPADAAERAAALTLAGVAERITTPLLVVMGARDRLFPASDGRRLVEEASGYAELIELPTGNHGCANVVALHRSQSADWMAVQLSARQSKDAQ